jgi:segregation and condensation protein B
MNLRAKLEAVIYAAEEPVTLAQLAALFADEALEWRAGQQEAAGAEATKTREPLPMVDQGLAYLGLEQTPEFYSAATSAEPQDRATAALGTDPAPAPDLQPAAAAGPRPAGSQPDTEAVSTSGEPLDPEAETKLEARKRDREVKAVLRQILDELVASYSSDDRGVEIREIAGGFRMATKPACHDAVRGFIRSQKPPMKLSLPALETLAVIAYKQPVTAPEVNEIRGVDSSGVFGSLLSRKLITTAGRKQVIGRPILYKTTREFLVRFGLKDVSELPSMEEFEKMAAIELSDAAESEEEIGGPGPEGGPELDENACEEDGAEDSPSRVVIAMDASEPEAAQKAEVGAGPDASELAAEPEPAPHE